MVWSACIGASLSNPSTATATCSEMPSGFRSAARRASRSAARRSVRSSRAASASHAPELVGLAATAACSARSDPAAALGGKYGG